MGFFSQLTKLTLSVVTAPIAIVSDYVTLGGVLTESESAIKKKAQQIADDYENVRNSLDKD